MRLIDLSHPLKKGMTSYPGDPPIELEHVRTIEKDGYNAFYFSGWVHVGTHVDVPMHLVEDSRTVADFPLDRFCCRAALVTVPRGAQVITADMLQNIDAPAVLFYTGWDENFGADRYFDDHPVLGMDAAEKLVSLGVKLVGFDSPSPDPPPYTVHKYLLAGDICIVENLVGLGRLEGLEFDFFAPPLNMPTEGSLIRAFAVVR